MAMVKQIDFSQHEIITAIERAVKKANGKDAKFIKHSEIVAWVDSLGTVNEKQVPQ